MIADALVVGAGAAGLACARSLDARGLRVVVLEARDRVGGRLWTSWTPDGEAIELGAQVIHGRHASTWDIVREAGLRTEPMTVEEDISFVLADRSYDSADLPSRGIAPPWLVEAALCQQGDVDASVLDRLGSLPVSGATRALAREWLTQVWGADLEALSVAAIAGVRRAWASGDGEWRILAGFDRLAAFMAEGLDVRVREPVRRISWRPGHVDVITDRRALSARTAVVTAPPTVVAARTIRFEPVLPSPKHLAAEQLRLGGSVVVVHQLHDPAPASAWALLVDGCGGFWRTQAGSRFLVAWIKGPRAADAAGSAHDQRLAGRVATALFPASPPGPATAVRFVDWGADPYAGGGFSYPSAGALDASGEWAAPVAATLFFAGEATCGDRHPATVQGALESGWRAADELAAALGS